MKFEDINLVFREVTWSGVVRRFVAGLTGAVCFTSVWFCSLNSSLLPPKIWLQKKHQIFSKILLLHFSNHYGNFLFIRSRNIKFAFLFLSICFIIVVTFFWSEMFLDSFFHSAFFPESVRSVVSCLLLLKEFCVVEMRRLRTSPPRFPTRHFCLVVVQNKSDQMRDFCVNPRELTAGNRHHEGVSVRQVKEFPLCSVVDSNSSASCRLDCSIALSELNRIWCFWLQV